MEPHRQPKPSNQPSDMRPETTHTVYSTRAPGDPAREAVRAGRRAPTGCSESAAAHGLMAAPPLSGLMAPGSEHLQRTRKSLAVVNGRQGQQQEASSSYPLVGSCPRSRMAAARTQALCPVWAATQLELPLGPRSCSRPAASLLG